MLGKLGFNANSKIDYNFSDYFEDFVIHYYRLKQVDYNGQFKIYDIISADNLKSFKKIVRYVNILGQEIDETNAYGVIIVVYSDGTTQKIIK